MSDSSATPVLRQDTLEVFGSPSYWVKGTDIDWILGTGLWAGQSTNHLFEIRAQYIAQVRPELMILLPQTPKCWRVLTSLVWSFKFPAQI